MGKVLEIHSDIVWGTNAGGQGKDYTFLKFVSAPRCETEDPRKWIKAFHRDANFKPVTIFALRVERDGIMFLVWSQTSLIGERDGDGRYTYIYVPSDLKISGRDICRTLFETKKLSETTGNLSPEFEKAVNEKEWESQAPSLTEISHRDEERYGYVHYETEQELIKILDHRHQKAFGMYKWVALSDKDAKDFIKSGISVVDITSRAKEKYVLWEPSKFARGEWSPVLKNSRGIISPNTYVYPDEGLSLTWSYKDTGFRYDGYSRINSLDDLTSRTSMDKCFKSSKILSINLIKISGVQVSANDLVYHGNVGDISVEIVNKEYCVYLTETETLKLERLELKNKGYSLHIEGDGVVITRRNSTNLIYFEDDYLCRINENGVLSPGKIRHISFVVPNKDNERKYIFRRNEIAYFLKHKWWFLLILFVMGFGAGFFMSSMLSGYIKPLLGVFDPPNSDNNAENPDGNRDGGVKVNNTDNVSDTTKPNNEEETPDQSSDNQGRNPNKGDQEIAQQYTLTFTFVENARNDCKVTVNGTEFQGALKSFGKGAEVIITVTPKENKKVKSFKVNGTDMDSEDNEYSITMNQNTVIIITTGNDI